MGSAIGSGGVTLLFKILEKLFDEWLANKRLTIGDKRKLADEVVRLCAEARTTGFNVKPRVYEHVLFIAQQVGVFDREMGEAMEVFARTWYACGVLQDIRGKNEKPDDIDKRIASCRKLRETAEEKCELLLSNVSAWKN